MRRPYTLLLPGITFLKISPGLHPPRITISPLPVLQPTIKIITMIGQNDVFYSSLTTTQQVTCQRKKNLDERECRLKSNLLKSHTGRIECKVEKKTKGNKTGIPNYPDPDGSCNSDHRYLGIRPARFVPQVQATIVDGLQNTCTMIYK